MSHYTDILFDLDGTLTDPQIGITRSVQYALRYFDIHISHLDTLTVFIGPPLLESFQRFFQFDEKSAFEAIRYYREYFAETGIFENKLYPGIADMLAQLSQNMPLYMATSKATVFAQRIAEHFNIAGYFTGIVGSNLDGSRTNKAAVIRHVIETHHLATDRCVMIGDREHDIIGAKANAMDSIGVLYGFGSQSEIEDARPTYQAQTVADLHRQLSHLSSGASTSTTSDND